MALDLMSNYSGGFANGVSIRGVSILQTHSGNVFWVHSSGSNTDQGTISKPFSTVAYAMTRCTATNGDIIVVKPGHAETVSDATTQLWNVAGVAVIGLGVGSSRPKFTLDTANTAAIVVSAANVAVQNCQFVANFLSIATCFTLTTAKWFTIENCIFTDTSASLDFLNCIKSTGAANTADGLYVAGCQWFGTGVTSVNSMVLVADANNFVVLNKNRAVTERTADAPILLTVTTGASLNIELGNNVVVSKQTASTDGVLAKVGASSTGIVYGNYAGTLVTASDILFTTTVGLFPFENRVSGVVGKTGFVIPAVDS